MDNQFFTVPFVTCENVQERLKYLRGIEHRKWREVQSGAFLAIPVGTLYKIMKTGKVPKKWWKTLGIVPKRPRIAISKTDMHSASRSILRNIDRDKVAELSRLLIWHLLEE